MQIIKKLYHIKELGQGAVFIDISLYSAVKEMLIYNKMLIYIKN